MGLAGRSFRYNYESGLAVIGRFSEGEIAWMALSGPGKGSWGRETIHVVEAAPGVWFVSWVETTGTTVSQVLDTERGRVVSFVTWPKGDRRESVLYRGTIEPVD